jgi:hypothetical protein
MGRRSIPSPAASVVADIPLLLLGLAAASTSIASLLLHAVGWLRMPFTASFVTLPGLVLLLCVTVWAGRARRDLMYNRLVVGLASGAVGLVVYDVVRLVVAQFVTGFDAFYSIRVFGNLITGAPVATPEALAVGFGYHTTNGLTFGVIYALLAGPARWWWGLAWGLVLEIAMILVYPAIYIPTSSRAFLTVSIVGHAAFGSVIGLACQRYARPARGAV